jgi:hypothetical protein
MPGRGLFVSMGKLQDPCFLPVWTRYLQTDWEPPRGKTTRNRDRRQPPHVERASVPEKMKFARAQLFRVLFQLGERWGRNGRGWCHEQIDLLEYAVNFAAGLLQLLAALSNRGRANAGAGLDAL